MAALQGAQRQSNAARGLRHLGKCRYDRSLRFRFRVALLLPLIFTHLLPLSLELSALGGDLLLAGVELRFRLVDLLTVGLQIFLRQCMTIPEIREERTVDNNQRVDVTRMNRKRGVRRERSMPYDLGFRRHCGQLP